MGYSDLEKMAADFTGAEQATLQAAPKAGCSALTRAKRRIIPMPRASMNTLKHDSEKSMIRTQEPDDVQLMACIKARQQQCLEQLHERYYTLVYSMAKTILRDEKLAEEVAQDIFLVVWQQPQKWNPAKGRLSSWLLTVTRYSAIDRLRYEQRREPTVNAPLENVAHLLQRGGKSEEAIRDNIKLVRRLLKQLPDEQQQVIYLAYFQGMTQHDIAEHLSLPLGTVKSRMRLGLRKLRDSWREVHEDIIST